MSVVHRIWVGYTALYDAGTLLRCRCTLRARGWPGHRGRRRLLAGSSKRDDPTLRGPDYRMACYESLGTTQMMPISPRTLLGHLSRQCSPRHSQRFLLRANGTATEPAPSPLPNFTAKSHNFKGTWVACPASYCDNAASCPTGITNCIFTQMTDSCPTDITNSTFAQMAKLDKCRSRKKNQAWFLCHKPWIL